MTLPPDCEKRIAEHVELDYFDSPEDVIRAALDALSEKLTREQKLAELRREIDVGIADADAGRVFPFTRESLEQIKADVLAKLPAESGQVP